MLFFHEGNHGVFIYVLYELNPNSSTPIMNETKPREQEACKRTRWSHTARPGLPISFSQIKFRRNYFMLR